ncbi:MAG TPA: 4Fe-4S dicluster domain-containing protein [candidate division Zixibacteria bacterium]|nr:4Fe-4S dicluster domain-containing protein [candidate division Zixibacteria bacterium]
MGINRRGFLKVSSLTALGLAGGSVSRAFGNVDSTNTPVDSTTQPPVHQGPLTAKRWAMVIDLRKCNEQEGCSDCSKACHLIHNVPEFDNPKDEVKWIWKESFEHVFEDQDHPLQMEGLNHMPTLVLCNHCDNPPCVRVCPTNATFRRESDGVVMMDWHRCIGCRYCVAACPYGSRSFNWRDPRPHIKEMKTDYPTRTRGVVEKCTFCEERLARGKMPACVEACKHGALIFGDLEDPESEVRKILQERYTIRRRPSLGTNPEVYYVV